MPDMIEIFIDGAATSVAPGITVAAALAIAAQARAGAAVTRRSVSGQARAAFCGMGVCQECRVTIDGRAHSLACQAMCSSGMRVETGAAA